MLSRRNVFLGLGALTLAGGGALAARLLRDGEPPAPPATDANGHLLWRNWSGIQHAYPQHRWAPQSLDELASEIGKRSGPIRTVGSGHSFTPLVNTRGTLLSLDAMTGVIARDDRSLTACVHAGTRLGALGPALAALGQEMPNLPDINKQSLGGALATGTHGTGRLIRALHGEVRALQIVTARGDVIECDAADHTDLFNAARVGLGAFGIVTRVDLANRVLTRVRKRTFILDTQDAIEQWPSLVAKHRNVEFYAIPFTGLSAVITVDPTDSPSQPRGPDRDTDALMDLKRLRDLTGFSTSLRRKLAQSALRSLPPEEAVDEGWKLLSNERPVRFNEMEYHLPLETQMPALQEAIASIEKHRKDVFFPIEVRIVADDDAWLSPFHGGPRGSVAVHAYYRDDYKFLYDLIEPIFRRNGGRPHWGKLHSLTSADFATLYPRWRDALRVRDDVDPEGRFLNDHLRRVLT